MNDTKQATCEDRIAQQFENLESEISTGAESITDYEERGPEVYGVSRRETISLQLSGGGPADYVELELRDGEVMGVFYRFSDWFDTARVDVPESSPVYEWALQQLEWVNL